MATPMANGSWAGQRLNLSHSCELHHSCGNTRSFNPLHWARNQTHTSAATQATAVRFFTDCTTAEALVTVFKFYNSPLSLFFITCISLLKFKKNFICVNRSCNRLLKHFHYVCLKILIK